MSFTRDAEPKIAARRSVDADLRVRGAFVIAAAEIDGKRSTLSL